MVLKVYFQRYDDTLVNYQIVDLDTTLQSTVIDDLFISYENDDSYEADNMFEEWLGDLEVYLNDEAGEDAFKIIKEYIENEDLTVEELIEMLER